MEAPQVKCELLKSLGELVCRYWIWIRKYCSLSYSILWSFYWRVIIFCFNYFCSNSSIQTDGLYLIEADRVLKPGGYFVLTLPLTKSQGSASRMKNQNIVSYIEEFVDKICWNLLSQQDETFVWQKTADSHCYAFR